MPRILALDVGEKTIGVAYTDETGTMAFPGETILREQGYRRDMAALRQLVADRRITRIVVGVPLLSDGALGDQADKVERFIAQLRGSVRVPIERQDESYTTASAEALLDEIGRPRAQQKRTIDSIAACLVLRDYLGRTVPSPMQNDSEGLA